MKKEPLYSAELMAEAEFFMPWQKIGHVSQLASA